MYCEIQARLKEAWSSATQEFGAAVSMLIDEPDTTSKIRYQELKSRAAAARLSAENARMLLSIHREEHGC